MSFWCHLAVKLQKWKPDLHFRALELSLPRAERRGKTPKGIFYWCSQLTVWAKLESVIIVSEYLSDLSSIAYQLFGHCLVIHYKKKIPGSWENGSKVVRFGSKSKVCSQKLGEITENPDFKYQVQLGGVKSLFFVVLSW